VKSVTFFIRTSVFAFITKFNNVVMDSIIKQCVEWDVVNWSKALKFWEKNVLLDNGGLRCLELGGRRGGLSLWLAIKGNDVICSDFENPKQAASAIHSQFTFGGSIDYLAVDATKIPFENYFDIVVFKSILGGISRNNNSHLKQVVVDEVYKSLKPGGKLLFAENLVASDMHQFFRRKLTNWGSYWNYLRLEEVKDLLKQFNSVSFATAGFLGAFGRVEFQRNLLGKLDTLLFDKVVADKMKYIVFGVATK
jgi:SAM-dependent methyltransferase